MKYQACAALAALLLPSMARAQADVAEDDGPRLEVRVVPDSYLIANTARPVGVGYQGTSSYFDLVVQAIAVLNVGSVPVRLENGWIELRRGKRPILRQWLSLAEVARASGMGRAMQSSGMQIGLDVHYGGSSLLPEGITVSPQPNLAPGTAALVDDYYLAFRALPDELVVHVEGRDETDFLVTAETSLPVQVYQPKNQYVFPLESGSWFINAFPGIKGHHRWTTATEHAIDISLADSRGSWAKGDVDDWHTGKVKAWTDWYAYDKKVLAAADGKVVKVYADEAFPLEVWGRKDGESWSAYQARVGALQQRKFLAPDADSLAVAGGNHIVIEHSGGEHSMYGHLAYGTILVEEGDVVEQGQHIAGLGGTGEIPIVHLHFQVTEGITNVLARTVPVKFVNAVVNGPFAGQTGSQPVFQPGYFVTVGGM